jgi:thiol-disulfide isomerase/thioredoxin
MEKVAYIEVHDINPDGSLKPYVNNGKKVIIMCQGHFCDYCQDAKPAFEQCANELNDLVMATIVTDGDKSEQKASKFIKKWDPTHRGVPAYMGFGTDGKFKKVHNGGRSISDIKKFSKTF